MMLQAFIDDSGRGQGPTLVLSGYLAPAEKWEAFAREWRAELDVPPSVEYFKAKESEGPSGQFIGHKRELIEYRIEKLLQIVERHVSFAATSILSYRAYENILLPFFRAQTPIVPKHFMNPYFFCFYDIVVAFLRTAFENGDTSEPLDFIFDEQGAEGPAVRSLWPVLRAMMPNLTVRQMMRNEPIFRNAKDMLPLQAADLLAWHFRNHMAATVDDTSLPPSSKLIRLFGGVKSVVSVMGAERCRKYIHDYQHGRLMADVSERQLGKAGD